MVSRLRHNGFSLVEVMLSAGILAIGFMLIAGAFPVGAKLTAVATERTIGFAAAEDAFAKIRLYGVDGADGDWPGGAEIVKYSLVANAGINLDYDATPLDPPPLVAVAPNAKAFDEYNYPSTNLVDKKKYRWSALCRDLGGNQLQVTVFVCRLTGLGVVYPNIDRFGALTEPPDLLITEYPAALRMKRDTTTLLVPADFTDNIITIDINDSDIPAGFNMTEYVKYVMVGSTLIDGRTGTLMYVTGREGARITLLEDVDETGLNPDSLGNYFWVIPPSVKTDLSVDGRYPCVEVYQRVITF